ncbi:fatty-acyl-CoA synthase [Saccharopolyspora antimicrobica]|uniref:Fatty-acyl-CoA synthase n=1 Tax=Saccharopolyspora antimicrobica TaxID=455193 RepID=A0A1I5ETV1_9PSEU|nr:fatty acyl-AMP ligase [Saccharopolyspora antimicrobica]RKT83539.1 fatty-acyl-CoA synthase [Saccharopolyspora antimicrobica]SFO14806.1 fatty-acyl-CoA synthase [Saccharopolyspora antimicrobica]
MSRFVEALVASAQRNSGDDGRGLTTGEPAEPWFRTWGQVHADALGIAGALGAELRPGAAVAVLAADPALIAPAVQAVWLGGGSVTMLHQPTPRTDLAHWAEDTLRVLKMIGARLVLLGPPFEQLSGLLDENSIAHRDLAALAESDAAPLAGPVEVGEDATALLQLTSGSTADPKAVRITHGNLHANLLAMVEAAELDAERDVAVSWLPLFHDMGMVGCLTVPMAIGMSAVKVTPADFLSRPLLWPELITKYRGTVTAAPNFAYAIVGRRMARADDGDFDLSSVRFTLNGAEPIDPAAVRTFTEAGARFGLSSTSMVCAFGMAEATLAVSFAPLGRGLDVDVVDGDALERRRAEPVSPDTARARQFALLGGPLPGLEVDVVDDDGRRLGERQVGRLRIRGAAVTPGYLTVDGPLSTQDSAGWLDTGDDGYLVDGQVVICGRRKDVIIMGGRNIYPIDIERAAGEVEGVRAGNAAAVRLEAGSRRERFAVVLESRLAGDEAAEKALRKEVAARVVDAVGVRPSAVVVLAPGSLPKTPSGKLQRAATAALVPTD